MANKNRLRPPLKAVIYSVFMLLFSIYVLYLSGKVFPFRICADFVCEGYVQTTQIRHAAILVPFHIILFFTTVHILRYRVLYDDDGFQIKGAFKTSKFYEWNEIQSVEFDIRWRNYKLFLKSGEVVKISMRLAGIVDFFEVYDHLTYGKSC